ncbi:MAG: hypothetical protein RMK65_00430 [Anaerolineae bacterium]|nr:hypothetical protein [Anaerolineae bacterium]
MDLEPASWSGVLAVVSAGQRHHPLPGRALAEWTSWDRPTPQQQVRVEFADYEIRLPPQGIQLRPGSS